MVKSFSIYQNIFTDTSCFNNNKISKKLLVYLFVLLLKYVFYNHVPYSENSYRFKYFYTTSQLLSFTKRMFSFWTFFSVFINSHHFGLLLRSKCEFVWTRNLDFSKFFFLPCFCRFCCSYCYTTHK